MIRPVLLWLSNSLIVVGVVLLLGTGAVYGYSTYEQARANREAASLKPAITGAWTPSPVPTATPTSAPVAVAATTELSTATPSVREQPTRAIATATPTPAPVIYPAERIVAPSIHLDAVVKEAPVVNGQWEIPKFAAGHLEGTAQPLQGNNVVLAGHVESISSGDVFANIASLKRGDTVRIYTKAAVVTYTVDTVQNVANDDTNVLQPTPREVLTLITCAGAWLPLQHDYTQRTVVIASRTA